jgi:hypothetical protein
LPPSEGGDGMLVFGGELNVQGGTIAFTDTVEECGG